MVLEPFDILVARFVEYCRQHLDFCLGDMQYHSCLPLFALDAVFSIGVRYSGVRNTVDYFYYML